MIDKIRAGEDIKEYIKEKNYKLSPESLYRINQFEDFNWGGLTGGLKYRLIDELTVHKQYESDLNIEEGDVVVDWGWLIMMSDDDVWWWWLMMSDDWWWLMMMMIDDGDWWLLVMMMIDDDDWWLKL